MPDWTEPETTLDDEFLPAYYLNNLRDRLDYLYRGQSVRLHQSQVEVTAPSKEWSVIPFNLIDSDTRGVMGDADNPSEVPITEEGVYVLQGQVYGNYIDAASFTGAHYGAIRVSGKSVIQQGGWNLAAELGSGAITTNMLTAWWCKPGDVVDLRIHGAEGGRPSIGLWTHLSVVRVAMPWRPGDPDWTTPATWTAAVPDAADLNELGDQTRFLKNRLAARLQSDADQSLPDNTITEVVLPRKVFGPPEMHVPGTNGLVLPKAGPWMFGGGILWSKNPTGRRHVGVYKATTSLQAAQGMVALPVSDPRYACWNMNVFAAGDVLTLRGYHNRGSALAIENHYPYTSHLWAVYIGAA